MKFRLIVGAVLFASLLPTGALADDPRDPEMRSAAARARDRAIIRQLNLAELAKVRERDAQYAEGWRNWHGSSRNAAADPAYSASSRDYERERAAYARNRVQYEGEMAAWRRAVAACRAGDYSAC
jgi:hypothetical protein